jgi:DNA-binding NtrC family response regulator
VRHIRGEVDETTLSVEGDRRVLGDGTPSVARLRIIYPLELAAEIEVGTSLVIGRRAEPGADQWAIVHPTVSRQHAKIAREATGAHAISDLGSHNGSWLDGAVLTAKPIPLSSGAVIRFGDVLLVYEEPSIERIEPLGAALPGHSNAMRRLRAEVERAAATTAAVLISGETGAGKERVAREIHYLSGRTGGYAAFNTNEVSSELFASALFGHEPGAFTGADSAHLGIVRSVEGGTLLLDEIGDLEPAKQVALLRLLEERELRPLGRNTPIKVDVRFLAATNRDLREDVADGRFRRDLYARLSLVPITVPPLRMRRMDIPEWIARFDAAEGSEAHAYFTAEAMEAAVLHAWPENLRGVVRLVHAARARSSEAAPFGKHEVLEVLGPPRETEPPAEKAAALPIPTEAELKEQMERLGSVRAVAKHFGRDRRQIYRWLDAYGLRR